MRTLDAPLRMHLLVKTRALTDDCEQRTEATARCHLAAKSNACTQIAFAMLLLRTLAFLRLCCFLQINVGHARQDPYVPSLPVWYLLRSQIQRTHRVRVLLSFRATPGRRYASPSHSCLISILFRTRVAKADDVPGKKSRGGKKAGSSKGSGK